MGAATCEMVEREQARLEALLPPPDHQFSPDYLVDEVLAELDSAPVHEQARAYMAFKGAGAALEDRLVRELVRVGQGPALGRMPIGGDVMGASFRNHPANDPFVISAELFDDATIKNVWESATQDYRGFGTRQSGFDLPNKGLLAQVEVIFEGTYTRTDGAGSHTVTDYTGYGLLESIELLANSQSLKAASGLAYDFRRQVVTRKAVKALDASPTAAGANTWHLSWLVPVADNMRNLWGAIYAQADDTSLRLELINAAQAKIVALTGNATAAITGATYKLVFTAFEVKWVEIKGVGLRIVLPEVDVLHRFHEYSEPVASSGEKRMKLQRSAGEVERIFLFLDNAASTLMDPSTWTEVRFAYLATEEPMRWPAKQLLRENADNYSDRITPKCAVIDLAAKNQRRDGLFPKAVVDPEVVVEIPSSVTVNAGARLFAVQEMLVGGA